MARASSSSTKFASVNLNKSYGKPAAPQGAQLQGSGAARSRIASHGGMLLLTRPVRSQPAAAAAVQQKGAKLTVPLPVNLPSLRREHAGNDPTIALVGGGTGASGWQKQQQQREAEEAALQPPPPSPQQQGESNAVVGSRSTPALSTGSTWGTSQHPTGQQPGVNPAAHFAPVNGELRPTSSPQTVARSGVYTPPRARTAQNYVPPPPSKPATLEKAVVLRGEDFPTLQAALPPVPPPPQHRQKELQQKQREKQQELKDQHQKLQQLSQKHPGDEQFQPQVIGPQLQPSQPVSLQPNREVSVQSSSNESVSPLLEPQPVVQAGSRPGYSKAEGFSSYGPPPLVRVNQRSNWTDDEREPAQSLRPQGQYSEWPDRPEREHFLEEPRRNSRGDDHVFGRQSSQRENQPPSFGVGTREGGGFGRDVDVGREGGFSSEGGGYTREGNLNSSYNLTNNHERYGREGMGSRDGFPAREGGFGGHGKDGGYNRDPGLGREGGGYGRSGAFGREYVPGRESNLDSFGRSGGRDFTHERESFSFRDGFGRETREGFHRDASYSRDGNFNNRDGTYGRDNRRGEYDGGRGRYGERFGRGGPGRFNAGSDFNGNKGRGVMGLDSGLDFNKEKRFGMPYSEDAFAKDFPDLPGLDFRSGDSVVESKLIRRKKEEAKVSAFYDLEREAFEAELERVQKLQEQERLRKLEEKERAIEQARKEQEEQERLAREEVERQLRLEEEAREAATRAEQEALEAARKLEEEKRAREEEKRAMQLEEERRKENARRKLLELEERIAKREAEKKHKEEGVLLPEEDRLRGQRLEFDVAVRREVTEEERIVTSVTAPDQDDDDRAPLRPSRRPGSPLMPRSSQEDFSSRVKSPDFPLGRRMPDLRGGNAFDAERPRSFMSWRRDTMDNGSGPPQASLYGREESSEFQFNMPRERMYPSRGYGEREAFYGSPNSVLISEGAPGEFAGRKHGYPERRCQADETSNKRSASPRATTPESDGGYLESSFDRDGDHHWGRDKIYRQRLREGKRLSPPPPPPPSYLQVPDPAEPSYGRLRHSLAKQQPRVPPPPTRAPLQRPPLKSPRDPVNSSPSPLLHPAGDDIRGSSWQQDGDPEEHSTHSSRPLPRALPSDSSLTSIKPELLQRESSSSASEISQARESQGPQQGYFPSSRDSQSEDEGPEQQLGLEKDSSSPRDDSSFPPATSESPAELDEEDSEENFSPRTGRAGEVKSEEDDADYAEDEEEEEEEEDDAHGDAEDDQEEEELEDEDDDVAGEWEDDVEQDVEKDGRSEEVGTVDFISEYDSGTLEEKEESESEDGYKEYEQVPEQEEEDADGLKNEYDPAADSNENLREDVPDVRQQEQEFSQQAMAQPFLQHVTLSSSNVSLTPVVPVQTVQGESYMTQVQQPLSFMALSLPQSHATSVSTQVPSLLASLPVLQNSQEGPVTLQFGLLPGTSLLPASVPAIQIGSIQMPLHLHPQNGPQIHGSQAPLFQFGQLGHQTPLPTFVPPPPVSESVVQPQNASAGPAQLNGSSIQEVHTQGRDMYASQGDQPSKPAWATQTAHNAVGDLKSTDADGDTSETRNGARTSLRPERKTRERREGTGGPHIKALHRVGSEGALDSSSSENTDTLFDNSQAGDSSWQRSYSGGRGRGNITRWPGPPARGRGRNGSFVGRAGPSDESAVSLGNHPAEIGNEEVVRMKSSRRNTYRRTEFKVRDSTLQSERNFPDTAKQSTGKEKYSNASGWADSTTTPGNASDGSGSRDGIRESVSQLHDRKYYGETGQSSQSSLAGGRLAPSKIDRPGNNDATLKNGGRVSGHRNSRPVEGLLGKYSSEIPSESATHEQPGSEALSEEDDFIEVRSKRQMLNDRREQKEKEMKAKTKDMKAKEHAARKQRPPTKSGLQGEAVVVTGNKSERRSSVQSVMEGSNSNNSRQTVISSGAVSSTSVPVANASPQLLPPIGTPAGGLVDSAYDKRSKASQHRMNSSGGNLVEGDVTSSSAYENQDSISSTSLAWGGTRSTLQVVSLTQIQLEEAMKPVRFETPVPQQLPFGERSSLVLEPGASVSSASGKDKASATPSGPIGSLLAGEKIQFGAVTSPPIPLPSSRPLTPGLNAIVGSSIGPRTDVGADETELKNKSKRLSGTGNEVSPFPGKSKRTRGDEERVADGVDAEAEAAASAVAVAAISSDESVGSTHHGDGQTMPLRVVGLPGSGNKSSFGKSSATSSHSEYWQAERGLSMGDANTNSGLEDSMSVALPVDLSVEPTSMGPASNSSGLLLPSLPGGSLPYRGLEMGTMLGGPMFGFSTNKDTSQGPQGTVTGSVHDQGITGSSSGSGGWQPQHSGGVDSYYGGPPPSSFTGPFINPTGGIPSIQGPPHMLVYTNPFASVSQFGQLGVGFMGPQQYLPSGKQPDWKHTPVPTSGPGAVGSEVGGGGLGGIMSGQRNSGTTNNVQRMAPGPSVISTPSPFDLNLSAPFQIPGVEVSMQSQWSHVPGPPLHSVPISGPLMGFAMQSRHARGGPTHIGHLPHMMETTSGFNLVPASNPVSSGLFQSVDPAAQFPDELGLGDSSSSVTNTNSSFRGQRPSGRSPPVSSSVASPTGAAGVGVNSNKLRSGRRSSRVARGGSSIGIGGGNGGSSIANVGIAPTSGASGQAANGSRAPSPQVQSQSQMPPISLGQHSHTNPYSEQRGAPQQGPPRVGISSGVWSGQGRKGGGPGRPPVAERGSSGDKNFMSSSSKLKQVYVVKPSSSPRRNIGDASSNLFSGSEVGHTAVGN